MTSSVLEVVGSQTTDGYVLRFANTQTARLARWTKNEQRCCPFLSFTFTPCELRISGRPEAKDILRAALSQPRAAP